MIKINDRVTHKKHGLGTVMSFPNDYIVWVHFDNQPENQERGCYFNTLEKIDMRSDQELENQQGPLSNNAVRQAEAVTDTLTKISMKKEDLEKSGVKYDAGKPMLSLVNRECLNGIARAMEYGMKKYAKNNYKKGMDWSRIVDALLRHTTSWAAKEENDDESKLNHLYHAGACINMLLYYIENNVGKDDR